MSKREREIESLRAQAFDAARAGRINDAIAAFERIIKLSPRDALARNELGLLHAQRKEFAEAEAIFRRTIDLSPQFVQAYYNLGSLLLMRGEVPSAERFLRQALALAPSVVEIVLQLGATLQRQPNSPNNEGKLYSDFLAINPQAVNDARLLHAYGNYFVRTGNLESAIAKLAQIVSANPHNHVARDYLAGALAAVGRFEESISEFDQAIAMKPAPAALYRRATVLPIIPASRQQMLDARARFEREVDHLLEIAATGKLRVADPATEIVNTGFYLAYHGLDDRAIQQKLGRLYLGMTPELAWTAPHCTRKRVPRDRIRVGFFSTHLYRHTIGWLNAGLIAKLDRARFEVSVFQHGKRDDVADRIAESADRASASTGSVLSIPAAREQIASHELDVLFFTDIGMNVPTHCLAMVRMAHVQCATWGHPVTSGLPTIDYFISSEHLEPDDSASQYSEQLVKLPSLGSYYYRPSESPTPFDRARIDFGAGAPLIVSPQALFKFHPDFDDVMGSILRGAPDARLVLIEGQQLGWGKLLRERFAGTIPDVSDRIIFVQNLTRPEFLGLVAEADVNLDTPHFGGGNTSYEALHFGSPIVTWPSNFLRGRITYAQYMQMGVTDLIARDMNHYVELALRLAHNKSWREQMRAKIRTASAVLYEDASAVRSLEAFFERAAAAT